MLVLHARNIEKYYGDRLIIELDDLEVFNKDRIGIVGMNGAGKTTLLDMLAGALEPDSGIVERYAEISYIRQFEAGEGEADPKVLKEFGIQNIEHETMSGGELTRLKISRALGSAKGILFADEPTSNLDIKGIELLQSKLLQNEGAVILISHDRELLDAVCTRIIEIEDGKVKKYKGNYSEYRRLKELERKRQLFEYEQYTGEKKRLESTLMEREVHAAAIRKTPKRMGNSEARLHKRESTEIQKKLRQAVKSLETRLEKLEIKEKPKDEIEIKMELRQVENPVSKTLIRGRGIHIRFGKRVLLEDASFEINNGSKVALIGENGTGKTTLVKRVIQGHDTINRTQGVRIGYFDQMLEVLKNDRTILENVMETSIQREHIVRTILARLLFKREEVFKKVAVLSGGEKVKVAIAKLITSDVNLLILDEPTNYLDLLSTEAQQSLLREYEGTVLMVSHDRRFIDQVATKLLILENKKLTSFEGNYGQYQQWLEERKKPDNNTEMEELALRMRLAQITSRLSIPSKGDNMEELDRQFKEITHKLRELRS